MAYEVPVITFYITKFSTHKIYILFTQYIYVFCMDLKTNSNYFSVLHWYIRTQKTGIFKEREAVRVKRWTKWKTVTQQ